jgi:hypothetical protein
LGSSAEFFEDNTMSLRGPSGQAFLALGNFEGFSERWNQGFPRNVGEVLSTGVPTRGIVESFLIINERHLNDARVDYNNSELRFNDTGGYG